MRRIPELDALRGLAAIAIVLFHMSYPGPWYDGLLYAGVISLDLFFVLSGFLITGIILGHGHRPGFLRTFYLRRGLRIWPIYYLMVAVGTALVLLRPAMGDLRLLPYYLTYTQHTWLYFRPGEAGELTYILSPTWSLAIEEQFYIVWPVLVLALARRPRLLTAMMAGVVAMSLGLRLGGLHHWLLLARADGFALGGLLAVVAGRVREDPAARRRASRALGLLALLALSAQLAGMPLLAGRKPFDDSPGPALGVGLLLNSLLFFGLIGVVALNPGARWLAPLRWPALVFVGTISYGIYLYHLSAMYVGSVALERLGLAQYVGLGPAVTVLLIALMSVASWYAIEQPLLRLKDRIDYRRGPEVAPSAAVAAGPEPVGPASALDPRPEPSAA